jgi:hypothetical protein
VAGDGRKIQSTALRRGQTGDSVSVEELQPRIGDAAEKFGFLKIAINSQVQGPIWDEANQFVLGERSL